MKRIAFLSPLPPEASGIADYSAELLPSLRTRFDIDTYSAKSYAAFPGAHRQRPYDAVVYQLGNNDAYHMDIYRLLLRIPGIVVLHEYMLHHLIRGGSTRQEYVETMGSCYGAPGVAAARRLIELRNPIEEWSYPLFEPAVDASLAVIVHSEATRKRVRRSRPGARISVVPHHVSLDDMPPVSDATRQALRRELKIPDVALVFASFGHVTPSKRFDVTLRAFARLRARHPEAVYVIAGELSPHYQQVREMLAGPLGRGVVVTGRVTLARMFELMDLADIAVNLRHPVGGETSGTCVRLLGMGKPVIVSTGGWFAEIPEGCCARVATDRFEDDELFAVADALASGPELRRDMGAAASRWARDRHRLARTVDGYAEAIDAVIRDAPPAPERTEPWLPAAGDRRSATTLDLMGDLISAAADIGVPHTDRLLLPALAEAMASLGVDRHE